MRKKVEDFLLDFTTVIFTIALIGFAIGEAVGCVSCESHTVKFYDQSGKIQMSEVVKEGLRP